VRRYTRHHEQWRRSQSIARAAAGGRHRADAGRIVEAIRPLREARGIGLKEAKETVDRYVAAHPTLKRKLAAQQAAGGTADEDSPAR